MSPAVADELGLVEWRSGVVVTEVQAGSYAAVSCGPATWSARSTARTSRTSPTLKKRIAAGVRSVSIGREGMVSTVQFR